MYLFGYEAGREVGRKEGHDEGHRQGKQDGAVKAFAVGYDRGKRERDDEEEHVEETPQQPSFIFLAFVALVTALLLSLFGVLRQRGFF